MFHLILDRCVECVGQFLHRAGDDTLEAASLCNPGIADLLIQLRADEIVVKPKG